MAWKCLRPPALNTVGKSMYIGALISLLTATFLGTQFTLIYSVSQNFIPHWLLFPSKYDKLICLLYRKRMASVFSKLLLGHLFDVHLFLHLVNTH